MSGVADGKPHRTVAEVGDQVQPTAERFDVTGNNLEGRHFAMFDLRHPGDTHTQSVSDFPLGQADLLAGISELGTPSHRQEMACAGFDLLWRDTGHVELALQFFPVPGNSLRHGHCYPFVVYSK